MSIPPWAVPCLPVLPPQYIEAAVMTDFLPLPEYIRPLHLLFQMSDMFLPFQWSSLTLLSPYTLYCTSQRGSCLNWVLKVEQKQSVTHCSEKSSSCLWLSGRWKHRLFIGALWYHITENKKYEPKWRGTAVGTRVTVAWVLAILSRMPDISLLRP